MEVIIAARLSQKIAGKGQDSITSQDIDARDWAREQGHNVIATVPDTASGVKAMWQRPNLKAWVTEPSLMAKYQGIVAAKQDRLSRADWRDEAELRIWAETHNKTLFIVDRDLRWPPREGPKHDDDVTNWNRGAEEAHREWANTSRRFKRMHQLRISNNELSNRRVYGYKIQGINCGKSPCRCFERGIDDHKTLAIFEPEAQYIREAVERYLNGETLVEICDDFNTREGQRWNFQTLAKRLRTPAIAGRRINAEGKTTLRYEGIIEWQKHLELVAKLDSRASRKGTSPANAYMLSGIIKDEAGHPIHGQPSKGWKKTSLYYRCRRGCGFMVRMDRADAEVARKVLTFGQSRTLVQKTIPGKNYFEEISQLRQDRAELDDLSPDYDERHAEIQAEIRRLASLPAEDDRLAWVPGDKTVAQEWEELDKAGRRDWLKSRQWKVIAHHDGTIEVIPGPMHGPTIEGIEVPVIEWWR